MTERWYFRKAHIRRLSTGCTISVRSGWVLRGSQRRSKGASVKRACPICGAPILSIGMPRGGWVHFEGGKGLTRVKHPCLHLGEDLSGRRDENTPDLFSLP